MLCWQGYSKTRVRCTQSPIPTSHLSGALHSFNCPTHVGSITAPRSLETCTCRVIREPLCHLTPVGAYSRRSPLIAICRVSLSLWLWDQMTRIKLAHLFGATSIRAGHRTRSGLCMDSYLQCSDRDTCPGLYHLEKPWVAADMLTPCVFRAGTSLEALARVRHSDLQWWLSY